jgi:hypothetical protein
MPGFIHVLASPSAPVIYLHTDTLMITLPAAAYQWYYDSIPISGTNHPYYTAALTGNYSVRITDFAGCEATSAGYYFSLVSIASIKEINDLVVYPNPVTDLLNIRFDSKEKNRMKIKIETIQGVLLSEDKFNFISGTNHFSINVSSLAAGIYFISLETSSGALVQKFIRE